MRSTRLITPLILLAGLAAAPAQELPFRTAGDYYLADQGNDEIYRFQDRNGDGDVQDAGEEIVFYDRSSPGPDLSNPQALTVHPGDGSVWVADTTLDIILRLEDRNGDGDARDPGEFKVFYDNTGPVKMGNVSGLAFDRTGTVLYLCNAGAGSFPADTVIRLEDRNADGDALDPGEATIYLDNSAVSGAWLTVPADMVFHRGDLYLVDNNTVPDAIIRMRDLNRDGDVLDAGEVVRWASPKAAGGSFVWNLVFESGGGALYGMGLISGNVFRWEDLNRDGDALDPGEATVFFNSARNASNVSLKTTFTITADPSGSVYAANHTADTIYRLTDLNADQDANDPGEVTVYVSNGGVPPLVRPMNRARDSVIGPAGTVQQGLVGPSIGKKADWLLDDLLGGNLSYVTVASLSNTGIPLPPPDIRVVPVTLDLLAILSLGGLPIFENFVGIFPPSGQSVVKIAIPAEPALVNVQVHLAFVTVRPASPSGILTVSTPYSFRIQR